LLQGIHWYLNPTIWIVPQSDLELRPFNQVIFSIINHVRRLSFTSPEQVQGTLKQLPIHLHLAVHPFHIVSALSNIVKLLGVWPIVDAILPPLPFCRTQKFWIINCCYAPVIFLVVHPQMYCLYASCVGSMLSRFFDFTQKKSHFLALTITRSH